MHDLITPLVLAFNEGPNLPRTLARLTWAREVILLDSGSTDDTLAIARRFPNVRIVERCFDTHVAQWNAGMVACATEWVLALDADYVLSEELVAELGAFVPEPETDAYFCRFEYWIAGKPLRSSLYPPRAVLFRRSKCHYVQDGHTQLLQVRGRAGWLENVIFHDDRKPLDRWLLDQGRYAKLEAAKLLSVPGRSLRWPDRWRKQILPAPVLVFLTTLFGKGLIFDGWRGWFYVSQRTIAELMLSLSLIELKCQKEDQTDQTQQSVSHS